MARTQVIRRRIRSVKNIKQITKAMEMVAASKLRRAQEATLRSRAYATSAREVLARLRQLSAKKSHPLFSKRTIKRRLIIVFSSDKGLAGAYNSNIFKQIPRGSKLIVIGNKGAQFVSRIKKDVAVLGVYTNWPTQPTSADIRPIVDAALKNFLTKEIDSVEVLYTDFVSMIKQTVTLRQILPIDPHFAQGATRGKASPDQTLFEPSPAEVLEYIVPRLLEVQIYQANLEAIASEHAARMVAMKNASDNAKEIIGDLTLTYNGVRQAAITQELAEITSGAEAIK